MPLSSIENRQVGASSPRAKALRRRSSIATPAIPVSAKECSTRRKKIAESVNLCQVAPLTEETGELGFSYH